MILADKGGGMETRQDTTAVMHVMVTRIMAVVLEGVRRDQTLLLVHW